MVFARQLAVRFGDVILGGVLGDTEEVDMFAVTGAETTVM